MKKYIRKADIILLTVLLTAGIMSSVGLSMSHSGGDTVIIESEGELYAAYSLAEDRVVTVPASGSGHYNKVTINSGKVFVSEASCKNQVCVHHSAISHSGESIVCLPNRLVVRIEGSAEKGGGYDSVTS